MRPAMLSISELHVRYGQVAAVRGIDLQVSERSIVCIVGPNGAGKSSTLQAIAGGVRAAHGAIQLGGVPLVGLSPEDVAQRGLSLVPEGRHVFESLTVEENLFLGGRLRRGRTARRTRASIFELFPILEERLKTPAGRLSGGEQQQLVIARALLTDPQVLLIDEPSLGLSPKMTDLVMRTILRLRGEGLTVLLVEQSIERALTVADVIYVMRGGSIALSGPGSEIRSHPELHSAYFGIS
jgi:branched-chain amino acid transport system ATP-binding protein